ncbi:hypothetical protein MYSTI_01564 [Myxococcus stipitatus DSM 14675]|uniref:Uncharacterized protein n=1 Tax=Myxococcus stipitatus (strain DSM 14675 / JCM 12634 / Mx s8) TaxID=1278073 RepID=L7U8Y3_MYXSD|nr:hypothetical protein [Myxococcus stipitatus]AGC42899.1 hypothetical protein MYSTI_01564 [Myxococcus stipitatus DSM 14675]
MKRPLYPFVTAGLAGLVLIAWALDGAQDAAPVTAAPARASPAPTPLARDTAPEPTPAPRPAPLSAAPEDDGEPGEFTTTTDRVKAEIFKTEPELARFDSFREHVLLDSNGREDYEALLADTRLHEQLRRALSTSTEAEETLESSFKRLMRIDYLREALAWRRNPARAQLVSTVERIILEDSFTAELSPGARRSMAATRMELFEIFADQEPARAGALVEAAKGTPLEKLVRHFAARNQRRQVKERKLSVQAQARRGVTP